MRHLKLFMLCTAMLTISSISINKDSIQRIPASENESSPKKEEPVKNDKDPDEQDGVSVEETDEKSEKSESSKEIDELALLKAENEKLKEKLCNYESKMTSFIEDIEKKVTEVKGIFDLGQYQPAGVDPLVQQQIQYQQMIMSQMIQSVQLNSWLQVGMTGHQPMQTGQFGLRSIYESSNYIYNNAFDYTNIFPTRQPQQLGFENTAPTFAEELPPGIQMASPSIERPINSDWFQQTFIQEPVQFKRNQLNPQSYSVL